MLTLDDANTILEKWSKIGFWYEVDMTQFEEGKVYQQDFLSIHPFSFPNEAYIVSNSSYASRLAYCISDEGVISGILHSNNAWAIPRNTNKVFIFCDDSTDLDAWRDDTYMLIPRSLQISVVNGVFDDKLYFDYVGERITNITIDENPIELHEDEQGKYIILPYAEDCVLGIIGRGSSYGGYHPYFNITFKEYKSLPQVTVDILYKGTPQTVKLYNNDTEIYITDFQAYYNGKKLKDNIIDLPYDVDDLIHITVDLHDPDYVGSTIRLPVRTELYIARDEEELEYAINNNIRTIKGRGGGLGLVLSDFDCDNITFVDSTLALLNCNLTDVTFISSTLNIRQNVTFINSRIIGNSTLRCSQWYIHFQDCEITGSDIQYGLLQFTGNIHNCNLDHCLLISDGIIKIIDNTFNHIEVGVHKRYFPNTLYLTGEYTVKNNTFNIETTYEEPVFQMCLIKTTELDVNKFISENNFDLNITCQDEPTHTLYYNLVDDDKIRAVRL